MIGRSGRSDPGSYATCLSEGPCLADNVDTIHWEYSSDTQDRLEAVCDIQNIADHRDGPESDDYFLDHGVVGDMIMANPTSRNSCMMSGRPARGGTVTGMGSISTVPGNDGKTRFGPDGVRLWSTLAAGMPDVIGAVEVNIFDGNGAGGAGLAKPDEPFWGYAARCMWNPEWEHLATVSLDLAYDRYQQNWDTQHGTDSYVPGRWCPTGSAWAGGTDSHYFHVGNFGNSEYHPSCGDAPPQDAGAPGMLWLDDNDCVRPYRNHALRVAIRPQTDAMVAIPAGNEGRRIRASTVAGYEVREVSEPRGCLTAQGFRDEMHPDSGPLQAPHPMSGPVRGRIFFANEFGDILGTGQSLSVILASGTATCDSPLFVPDSGDEAFVHPRHGEYFGPSNAFVSVDAEIPEGARYVGVVFDFPSTPQPSDPANPNIWYTHTVMASVSFGLEVWHDPRVTPGASPSSAAAWFEPNLNYAEGALPRSCTDPHWFAVSAWKAEQVGLPASSSCFNSFATNP